MAATCHPEPVLETERFGTFFFEFFCHDYLPNAREN